MIAKNAQSQFRIQVSTYCPAYISKILRREHLYDKIPTCYVLSNRILYIENTICRNFWPMITCSTRKFEVQLNTNEYGNGSKWNHSSWNCYLDWRNHHYNNYIIIYLLKTILCEYNISLVQKRQNSYTRSISFILHALSFMVHLVVLIL